MDEKPMEQTRNRLVVGRILLGTAFVMGSLAVLFYAGVVPIAEGSRPIVTLFIGGAAVLDAVLAVYFLFTNDA
jgi:Na+/citrate or Na+/malate symporter